MNRIGFDVSTSAKAYDLMTIGSHTHIHTCTDGQPTCRYTHLHTNECMHTYMHTKNTPHIQTQHTTQTPHNTHTTLKSTVNLKT